MRNKGAHVSLNNMDCHTLVIFLSKSCHFGMISRVGDFQTDVFLNCFDCDERDRQDIPKS